MHVPHVIIGMSGGVDSSIAAYLLKQQGYRVTGIFMKNWEDDDNETYCSSRQDWLDVVIVADLLNIDIEVVNFTSEYKKQVFSIFLKEYEAGRTPNPDVLCNSEIKFNAFLKHAMQLKADFISTGHYARCERIKNTSNKPCYELKKAFDQTKDQSYFLHQLNQYQLSKTLFPLGKIKKQDVRALALKIGLPNALKKDSTGLCFIGERPFRNFLQRYLQSNPGPIKDELGNVIGQHIGLSFYTIGQRKGLGIGGKRTGTGEAWFVAHKDIKQNTLYVVQGHHHPWLFTNQLRAGKTHWISGMPPKNFEHLTAKTRYRQKDVPCKLKILNTNDFQINFDENHWAVTPGQYAVLYKNDICLGGGIIY